MITKTQTPYEFLIRWRDGKISGAHAKFLETISEDGVVLNVKEGDAVPVSLAGEVGYPIADIFAAISAGAVASAQQAVTDIATADGKKLEAEAAAAKAAADLEAENARVAAALAAKQAAEDAVKAQKAFDAAVSARIAQLMPAGLAEPG
jgi:hypothetical protein